MMGEGARSFCVAVALLCEPQKKNTTETTSCEGWLPVCNSNLEIRIPRSSGHPKLLENVVFAMY